MPSEDNRIRRMPDVAAAADAAVAGPLDWVGMDRIDLPVQLDHDGRSVFAPARVSAYVNLNRPDVRGIHMSRLYLHLDRMLASEALSPCLLRRVLREFLASHAELSDRAMLRIAFDQLLRRPALVSDNSGWKSYPVVVTSTLADGHFELDVEVEVAYSSTCPCSAALARQLIQERFSEEFTRGKALDHDAVLRWLGSERGIFATPHAQRSAARVRARLAPGFDLPIIELVDTVEQALQTPVQTVVKREDEQAFARLNGENLMFCEDAARRIREALQRDERIADFHVRAEHFESLHAHNAVAVASKYEGTAGDDDLLA